MIFFNRTAKVTDATNKLDFHLKECMVLIFAYEDRYQFINVLVIVCVLDKNVWAITASPIGAIGACVCVWQGP